MAQRAAEQANHLKDEFLATVSHEFRTPLNAVLGWTRLLESSQLPRERAEHALAAIGRSASALAHMVDDLLDTSRILAGTIRLAVEPVDLASVAQAALDAVRSLATARNVGLTFQTAAGPRTIDGDPGRLQQVIWNLLANAIKFTPEGGHVGVFIEPSSVARRHQGRGQRRRHQSWISSPMCSNASARAHRRRLSGTLASDLA